MNRVIALRVVNQSLIPGILYGPPNLHGVISECRVRSNPSDPPGVASPQKAARHLMYHKIGFLRLSENQTPTNYISLIHMPNGRLEVDFEVGEFMETL